MSNMIVNNQNNLIPEEACVFDVVTSIIKKAIEQKNPININIATNLVFFDCFKSLLPYFMELDQFNLLSKVRIILGSEYRKNNKEFLFLFKNDSITLDEEDFSLIKQLYDKNILSIRLNHEKNFKIKLYIFEINQKYTIWSGSANLIHQPDQETVELLVPVNPIFEQDKKIYIRFFEKIWDLSSQKLYDKDVFQLLKESSRAEVFSLSPRNFISNLMTIINKEYLVKNISFDLSTLSEFQNLSYYLCIEKLINYGGVLFNNSIGFSKTYISAMIIKYYLENDKKVLLINARESEQKWLKNLKKSGVALTSITIMNRNQLLEKNLDLSQYHAFDLIIIDQAEYFSISKLSNTRYYNLTNLIQKNPDSQLLFISDDIINDSFHDLINIIMLINKGKYVQRLKNYGITDKIDLLKSMIEQKEINNKMITLIQGILTQLSVKIEFSHISTYLKSEDSDLPAMKKPLITTVKYAYDHEISVKIYEKIIPTLKSLKFEYYKLCFTSYYEDENLITWYKWKLYKKIESSITAFKMTIMDIREKSEFVKNYLLGYPVDMYREYFNSNQLTNINNSFQQLTEAEKESVLANIDSDIANLENLLNSINNIKYLENRDDKITNLLKILKSENKPTIIFTECEETLDYIKRRLNNYGINSVKTIQGGEATIEGDDRLNREIDDIEMICNEFEDGVFDFLIANDVIEEDIILKRAEIIINFDIPYNTAILSKRDRHLFKSNLSKKSKVYNFQADKRIDKEINLFEESDISISNIISFLSLDFIIWCKVERNVDQITKNDNSQLIYLTKEYKDFLCQKNPDEIENKFIPLMSHEDIAFREFIKFFNISEETLKLTTKKFKKPIFTHIKYKNDYLYIVYRYKESIYTINKLKFSDSRININLENNELNHVKDLIYENLLEHLNEDKEVEIDRQEIILLGIIKYSANYQ